jgi:hypothetical protein
MSTKPDPRVKVQAKPEPTSARLYLEVEIQADDCMFAAVNAIMEACRGYGEVRAAKVMDVPSTIHLFP